MVLLNLWKRDLYFFYKLVLFAGGTSLKGTPLSSHCTMCPDLYVTRQSRTLVFTVSYHDFVEPFINRGCVSHREKC